VVWGTRGNPGTVAPFRAWRGSRDLVAQSPKFHAPAVPRSGTAEKIVAQQFGPAISPVPHKNYFAAFASGGTTSAGFTQFTLKGPMAFTWTIVAVLLNA
jgi:hypothetical protein